jgi:hypothetical protein
MNPEYTIKKFSSNQKELNTEWRDFSTYVE